MARRIRDTPAASPTLRQRKAASTRLGLVDALVEHLRHESYDARPVTSLCERVSISVPTFFNHFSSKDEMLVLYVRLWSIEAQMEMDTRGPGEKARLTALFECFLGRLDRNPRLVRRIFSHILKESVPASAGVPTRAEILRRFPDRPDAAQAQPRGVGDLIRDALSRAVAGGELPAGSDVERAAGLLVALFFGVPALRGQAARSACLWGLDLVWNALGGEN